MTQQGDPGQDTAMDSTGLVDHGHSEKFLVRWEVVGVGWC